MAGAKREARMKSALILLTIAAATLATAACAQKEDDIKNVPGPNGLLPDGSPPRAAAPAAPDSGTYIGPSERNPRPPASGLNSDPGNPSGMPGSTGGIYSTR
jgi:hypothetical protein